MNLINVSHQSLYAFFVLIGVCFMAWYWGHPKPHHKFTTPQQQANIIIDGINSVQFNTQGGINQRLQSIVLQHYTQHNISVLTQPKLILVNQHDGPTWQIEAHYAKVENRNHLITLWGHVHIYQPQTKRSITTTNLNYYPKQQIAYTDAMVNFTEPGAVVNSQGLHANLKTQKIELLSHARGRYHGSSHQ